MAWEVLLHLINVGLLAQFLKISQKESFQYAFPFTSKKFRLRDKILSTRFRQHNMNIYFFFANSPCLGPRTVTPSPCFERNIRKSKPSLGI